MFRRKTDQPSIDVSRLSSLIAAGVEIAGVGVVQRVRPAPAIIGREGQHAERASDPVIAAALGEERPVTAIVLDDENAQQQKPRQGRQRQSEQIACINRYQHDHNDSEERQNRDPQLPHASPRMGRGKGLERGDQFARFERGCIWAGRGLLIGD